MNTNIAIIRDKLDVYGKPFVQKELLLKILEKFAPNYSINDLCTKGLLIPIKRGKRYINNKSKKFINPFVVGDLYMGDDIYMFGGISIYNKNNFSGDYLLLFLNSQNFTTQIESFVSGSAQPQLPIRSLSQFKIPLPPIDIQQQIVTEIEKEQAMVESAKGLVDVFEGKVKERIGEVWGE